MWYVFSALQSIFERWRTCRKCGHKQMVKPKEKNKPVTCAKCGNRIRPEDHA